MHTKAFDNGRDFILVTHLDESKVIPDPMQPAPKEGETDNRPLVAHPDWVQTLTWSKNPPADVGMTQEEWVAMIKRETQLLADDALARRQPLVEVVL